MEIFSEQPGDEGLPGAQRRLAMIALMISTTMAVFDGAMINLALPQIAEALRVSAASAVWVANGYLLSAAMTLAFFAALSARIGYRRQFVGGLTVFTLASAGCALSSSLEMLTLMRLLQGIGGAATLSIAPAILRSVFPNRLLGRILGLNALLIAASTALAPVLGGTLLSTLSWPWLFAINIPPGIIALLLASRVIPGQHSSKTIDIPGALLSAVMTAALIMAANSFSAAGHSLRSAQLWALAAVISGALFIWRQRRAANPLLPLAMFASSRFSLAALTSLASFVSQGITFIALPFLFQTIYGYSALTSAWLFTPWPVGIVLAAPHAGRLADRYSPAMISTVGLALFAVGLGLLALLPEQAQAWDIAARSLICGIGFGCFQSPNNREMLSSASRENSGYASGVLAIMRTFGQCLGTALVGVMMSVYGSSPGQQQQAVHSGLWIALAATLIAFGLSVSRLKAAER